MKTDRKFASFDDLKRICQSMNFGEVLEVELTELPVKLQISKLTFQLSTQIPEKRYSIRRSDKIVHISCFEPGDLDDQQTE